jgi:hypothetical protein
VASVGRGSIDEFILGGLHEELTIEIWNLGTISAFVLRQILK